jgi:hypothetical protein
LLLAEPNQFLDFLGYLDGGGPFRRDRAARTAVALKPTAGCRRHGAGTGGLDQRGR